MRVVCSLRAGMRAPPDDYRTRRGGARPHSPGRPAPAPPSPGAPAGP